jgi:hypothetical protein
MEGRLPERLRLEMWALPADELAAGGDEPGIDGCRVSVFANAHRDRKDLPRTLSEFDTLVVVENPSGPVADHPSILNHFAFARTPRPGQGSLTDEPTTGLQLVLISPKDAAAGQELRDWSDFVHIRHIAEAAVPGFRMITPYVNISSLGPMFLHFYEMHSDDPEGAFIEMTPRVAERLGGEASPAFADWAWHRQLRIDYVNTFSRVERALGSQP